MNIIATDPRDDFEKVFPLPKHVIRCGNGYACTEYNAWGAYEFIHKWEGWRAAKLGDGSTAAPAVQADQLSGNAEQVSQPYTLPLDYLQGYKDGCEWSALMAEANHPQTGDWLFDDPIELAKAIRKGPDMLPAEPGNSPAIPDGWIPVSERMPEQGRYISAVSRHGEYVSGLVEDDWLDLHDGTSFGLGEVYLWLPLPELPAAPKQEAE
ncbi:DUF551 domain-containing protein [Atlantibacter hermannii]|uniref:DUF551 domain-containing protein n=1 Tax=Atlantibacter hermannii TaxID=565 RepID=UPI00296EB68D|nr:DUF551 domain-containing protein [Atlantibacter hermannii]MDW4577447.1 hypothetical protein [Atlantibacter hermannii]